MSYESAFEEAVSVRGSNPGRYFSLIRKVWSENMASVMAGEADPYFVDWTKIFTPIERMAWADIRNSGLPFFPQIPVGRRFVDFGDPVNKIAIECDGFQFHNRQKDLERDIELSDSGWLVYHLWGRECAQPDFIDTKAKDAQVWMHSSSGGLMNAISAFHYQKQISELYMPYVSSALSSRLLRGSIHDN